MPRRIIFIQGPPRSGKDTAANALEKHFSERPHYANQYKFSRPLKTALREFFQLNQAMHNHAENTKDQPNPDLFDKTYREVQISLSEDWAKKVFGEDIFGRLMIRQLLSTPTNLAIMSDSGFPTEAVPVVDYFGHQHCVILKIHRPNCDFSNDSRNYWSMEGVKEFDVHNVLEKSLYELSVTQVVEKWLEQQQN